MTRCQEIVSVITIAIERLQKFLIPLTLSQQEGQIMDHFDNAEQSLLEEIISEMIIEIKQFNDFDKCTLDVIKNLASTGKLNKPLELERSLRKLEEVVNENN